MNNYNLHLPSKWRFFKYTAMKRTILFSVLVLFAYTLTANVLYNLERIEPPFWWVGMNNPELQVMLYGQDIGELTPAVANEAVTLKRFEKVESNNYIFLYFRVNRQAEPGTFTVHLKNGDETVNSFDYRLKAREENSAMREGFNNSDVMYLITPDRFANGDPENDAVEGYRDKPDRSDDYGRHGGDIQGIINRLDYIDEMGFTAIWLNPVLENAMAEASYHGYATTDYYKIDPRFGSNKLYKKLSEEAQKRGIKLIMDQIMNHCGSNHWWMDDPPTSDWLHYQDDYQQCNHRRTTLHDPYAAQIDKKEFTNGWFVESMPDLNQSNPLLADYLIYNSLWWIEYAGLQGIRHDTHPYPGVEFMNKWTCRVMQEYPNFNIVGEEWSPNPAVIAKWQRGSRIPADFSSCLPSLMDFPIQIALSEALSEKEGWEGGFVKLYEKLSNDFLYPDPYNLVIFPDNHDMDRFYRQVNQDYDLFKMGLTYILTMRGIPQIYYGTELLMSNAKPGDHGQIREDFPGGWASDKKNAFTGEGMPDKKLKAQQFVKKLVNWRKKNPVIHKGQLKHYAPKHDGIYTYFRYNEEKTVMVILNKANESRKLDRDYYYEMMNGFSEGSDLLTGETYSLDDLEVPARSSLILELE